MGIVYVGRYRWKSDTVILVAGPDGSACTCGRHRFDAPCPDMLGLIPYLQAQIWQREAAPAFCTSCLCLLPGYLHTMSRLAVLPCGHYASYLWPGYPPAPYRPDAR
jgi:hypothetical protein